jgi:uncharacterized protein YnzC (UPF0291/DUF896 family)
MAIMSTQYYSTNTTWGNWVSTGTTSGTISTYYSDVWNNWTTSSSTTTSYTMQPYPVWTEWVETDEQRVAREERELQRKKDLEGQTERRAVARDKSRETFLEHLNEQERVEFESTGKIAVKGSDGHTYHVDTRMGIGANVTRVEDDQPVLRLCAHPRSFEIGAKDPTPEYDHYLAQIITLKVNAEAFVGVANSHRLDFRPNVQIPA